MRADKSRQRLAGALIHSIAQQGGCLFGDRGDFFTLTTQPVHNRAGSCFECAQNDFADANQFARRCIACADQIRVGFFALLAQRFSQGHAALIKERCNFGDTLAKRRCDRRCACLQRGRMRSDGG